VHEHAGILSVRTALSRMTTTMQRLGQDAAAAVAGHEYPAEIHRFPAPKMPQTSLQRICYCSAVGAGTRFVEPPVVPEGSIEPYLVVVPVLLILVRNWVEPTPPTRADVTACLLPSKGLVKMRQTSWPVPVVRHVQSGDVPPRHSLTRGS
jgi:hypothetical protein